MIPSIRFLRPEMLPTEAGYFGFQSCANPGYIGYNGGCQKPGYSSGGKLRDMPGFEHMGKLLILVGVFITLLGLFLAFWSKIPLLGKLPGDIFLEKGNFFFPIVTCLVISAVFTIIINIIMKLFGK